MSATPLPPRHVVVLGSTGSIGRQALEVIAAQPELEVSALSAAVNDRLLEEQMAAVGAGLVALTDGAAARRLSERRPDLSVEAGADGLIALLAKARERAQAAGAELVVLNGIVGAAGLAATMATVNAGVTLALANKESLVAGGPFVLAAAKRAAAAIIPVDSEHSALFQCLLTAGERSATAVVDLILTGSGGPFRGRMPSELEDVTPTEALAHPNWSMGAKISVDSATLMNKGLEVIEAHRLFAIPYERISVAVNPSSVVHSMVRFSDGALIAHLGAPDMRTPIGYALSYPRRPVLDMVPPLDLGARPIVFEQPDTAAFRCLDLARRAGEQAASFEAAHADELTTVAAPVVLNAANEVAVAAFLAGQLRFTGIADLVEKVLDTLGGQRLVGLTDVVSADDEARRLASSLLGNVVVS